MRNTAVLLVGACVCSSWAFAEEFVNYRRGQGWSLLSGQTVGSKRRVAFGEFGFPGVSVRGYYGVTDRLDLGGQWAWTYAGSLHSDGLDRGWSAHVVAKWRLWEKDQMNFGLRAALGLMSAPNAWGLSNPLEFTLGFLVSSSLVAHACLEVPWFWLWKNQNSLNVPILAGLGAEYFLHQNFMLTLKTRMGPSFSFGLPARFTFQAMAGVAYRF